MHRTEIPRKNIGPIFIAVGTVLLVPSIILKLMAANMIKMPNSYYENKEIQNIIPQIEIALTIISGLMIIVGCVLFWKSNSCRQRASSIRAVSDRGGSTHTGPFIPMIDNSPRTPPRSLSLQEPARSPTTPVAPPADLPSPQQMSMPLPPEYSTSHSAYPQAESAYPSFQIAYPTGGSEVYPLTEDSYPQHPSSPRSSRIPNDTNTKRLVMDRKMRR